METIYQILKFLIGMIIGSLLTLWVLWQIVKQNGKDKK